MFLTPLLKEPSRTWRLEDADRRVVVAARVAAAVDSATRRRGLLGRDALDDEALVIAPCNLVHTCFMRFPIDTVFVDRDGIVVRIRHAVRPWRVAGAWRAFATIELPAGHARKSGMRIGARLRLTTDPAHPPGQPAPSSHCGTGTEVCNLLADRT
jgi:uncharacterized membrane protein (UPF0127 family)